MDEEKAYRSGPAEHPQGSRPGQDQGSAEGVYVDWGERFHGPDSGLVASSTTQKTCCQCGTDLTHHKRFRDSHGRYWCPDCNAADRSRHRTIPCSQCHTAYPHFQMLADQGKYLCPECVAKRMEPGTGHAVPSATPTATRAARLTGSDDGPGTAMVLGVAIAVVIAVASLLYWLS